MDIYHELREKLDSHPVGAPDRAEVYEILRILFTPEEAKIAIHIPFSPIPVDEIAKRSGLSVDEVIKLCEQLADKGLVLPHVYQGKKSYMLLPVMPGVFEYPFMKHKHLSLDFARLAELWHRYYDVGLGHEFHGSRTSMMRVIPVRKAISSASTVLPFEEVSNYINKAERISLGDCSCRVAERKCNNPIEVCLGFDGGATFLVEHKMARFITKEEALRVLAEAEEAGLVHLASNTVDKIGMICNCCPCCCVSLGAITRLKDAASHPISNFFAVVNTEDCTGCGLCEDRCPAKAIVVDGVAAVKLNLCIGCGLCASACPTDAIYLQRRADSTEPPASAKELAKIVAQEKGRLESFLANLK